MSSEKNLQVLEILNETKKSGPEITHAIAELGDGRMVDGLNTLWKNGQRNGIIRGSVGTGLIFTTGIGIYVLVKNKIEENRTKQSIIEANKDISTPPHNTVQDEIIVPEDSDELY